jgi:hypothetical protein
MMAVVAGSAGAAVSGSLHFQPGTPHMRYVVILIAIVMLALVLRFCTV